MAFRKNSIGVGSPSVTSPFKQPVPQIGDVNEDGLVWDGRAWTSPKTPSARESAQEDPKSGLPS